MWTEEALKKAAEKYFEEYYKHDAAIIYKRDAINMFVSGAKYIINNTQS